MGLFRGVTRIIVWLLRMPNGLFLSAQPLSVSAGFMQSKNPALQGWAQISITPRFCLSTRWQDRIRSGRKMPQTRTSTTCSSCWSSAIVAWAKHHSSSGTRTTPSRRLLYLPLASTSRSRQFSDTTKGSSYRYGYVVSMHGYEFNIYLLTPDVESFLRS